MATYNPPKTPEIPLAIVEWLERLYPGPSTDPKWSGFAQRTAFELGAESVARKARLEYTRQQEKRDDLPLET